MSEQWKAECVGVSDLGGNGHDIYEIVSADGYARICEYVSEKHAHLIAAAPDLLAALKELMGLAQREGWVHVAIKQAEAAIAKAENRATIQSAGGGK